MSVVVKTLDGCIVEIHGTGFDEFKLNDLVHDGVKDYKGTHYFKLIAPLSYICTWVVGIEKEEYDSLINTDAYPLKSNQSIIKETN